MTLRKWTIVVLLTLLAVLSFAIAGCAATVTQEDYDQVVADLDDSLATITGLEEDLAATQSQVTDLETQIADLEAQVAGLESQLVESQSLTTAAEDDLAALQMQVQKAALSAEIMGVFLEVGFGGGDLTEADAMTVFLELSEKVEASGDEGLQEKFQAVLFSFGGEQEALDLVEYMLGTMTALGDQ